MPRVHSKPRSLRTGQICLFGCFITRESASCSGRARRISRDQCYTYCAKIEATAAQNAELAADFERAADSLRARYGPPDRGNKSTEPLRATIYAAASAYCKLFGKPPGRSRSDYGRFGRFVLEIIERVPEKQRPARPSPSAIIHAVKKWALRRHVAQSPG